MRAIKDILDDITLRIANLVNALNAQDGPDIKFQVRAIQQLANELSAVCNAGRY